MQKLPEGVSLEFCPCPLGCDGGDMTVLEGSDRIHGIPGTFQVVKCNTCQLMRTNPRPTAATIGLYYPASYGPYVSTDVPVPVRRSGFKLLLRQMLGLDTRQVPPMQHGRLLELGCASGSYLEQMRAEGWSVQGIEFSDSAAERARRKGLDVQTGSVESAVVEPGRVDLVAAWMVIEHLHDPVGALRKIQNWVKPSGWLTLSIPIHSARFLRIFGGASYDLHLPNHLYHFSSRTIEQLLQQAGWEIDRMYWQRNANTLLWTLEYTAHDRSWNRTERAIRYLRSAESMQKVRTLLGWILGVTRSSGRVEIWARPSQPRSTRA